MTDSESAIAPDAVQIRQCSQKPFWLRVFALLASVSIALVSCATAPDSKVSEQDAAGSAISAESRMAAPPFFRVAGGRGATIELLGTFHLGPAEGWVFSPEVEEAIANANSMLMEIDLRDSTQESISDSLMRHGILPANTPLSKVVGPETTRLLETYDARLTTHGFPEPVREAMQPWYIMMMVIEATIQESEMQADQSVEETLMRKLGDRELLSLETLDEQLGFFGALPIPLQELMLQQTLHEWDEALGNLSELAEAWRTNDLDWLLHNAYEGVEETPDLQSVYEVLIDGRNRNWVPRLMDLLEDPKRADTTVLMAVGALHLVGPHGVPNLLEEAGYRVDIETHTKVEKSNHP